MYYMYYLLFLVFTKFLLWVVLMTEYCTDQEALFERHCTRDSDNKDLSIYQTSKSWNGRAEQSLECEQKGQECDILNPFEHNLDQSGKSSTEGPRISSVKEYFMDTHILIRHTHETQILTNDSAWTRYISKRQ